MLVVRSAWRLLYKQVGGLRINNLVDPYALGGGWMHEQGKGHGEIPPPYPFASMPLRVCLFTCILLLLTVAILAQGSSP